MASSDRFVAVGEEEILYILSNIFAKPQVFYYLMSDAKIFDIISSECIADTVASLFHIRSEMYSIQLQVCQ